MFYLNQFFKVFKCYPIRGLVFVLSSFILIFSIGQESYLRKKMGQFFSQPKIEKPHFYALISERENHSRVARKLQELPGVTFVETLSHEKVAKKAAEILEGFNLEFSKELINFDYAGLKVILSPKLKKKSQALIKDYLVRMVGENNITLGPIVQINQANTSNHEMTWFRTWSWEVLTISCFFLWVLCFLSFNKKIKSFSYIIEQFQRKKRVGEKIALSGVGFTFAMTSFLSLFWAVPDFSNYFMTLIAVSAVFLSYIGQKEWKTI